MRNSIFCKQILILLFCFSLMNIAKAQDQFNFNVTEIEIYNKGNLYKGIIIFL